MATSRFIADITVRALVGNLIAAVVVKNRIERTTEDAAEFRRNLMEYSDLGVAPYFLLLSQDYGYAWRQNGSAVELRSPDAVFSMSPVIAHYSGAHTASARMWNFQLELIVYRWLLDLTDGILTAGDETGEALSLIGFVDAIQDAIVELEPAVDSVR
ncbi:MAG: hypothetical protein AB7R89_13005 [Dehalococcoidia bacterium]